MDTNKSDFYAKLSTVILRIDNITITTDNWIYESRRRKLKNPRSSHSELNYWICITLVTISLTHRNLFPPYWSTDYIDEMSSAERTFLSRLQILSRSYRQRRISFKTSSLHTLGLDKNGNNLLMKACYGLFASSQKLMQKVLIWNKSLIQQ